jgi:hypothetical protein
LDGLLGGMMVDTLFGFPVVETEELKIPEIVVLADWAHYVGVMPGYFVVRDDDDIIIYKKKDDANS